ncbi:MAG: SlyX family protein [Alphaproteobacteria bacterium]|nr:SlyX family protein [Alphaproteobacteria bacterium]
MNETEINNRLIDIEMSLANMQKALDDLSDVVIEQGKQINRLQKQNEFLKNVITQDVVKPLSEETPPPHY